MNFIRTRPFGLILALSLAIAGAGICAWLVPAEMEAVELQLLAFPDSDAAAHTARPWVLAGLCFLPAIACFTYALGGTLDRYIARQFAGIFAVCLAALLAIWWLMDLSGHIGDFRDSENMLPTIIGYYATRSPAVLLLLLPYSLLLALLYSLGKLSGSREVIAIIQAGRSVIRMTLPLIFAGIWFSLLSVGLNYHWAPLAEGRTDEILDATDGGKPAEATNVLYRDPANRRLWQIGEFTPDYHKGGPLLDVEITTTRADKTLKSRLRSPRAFWDRTSHQWTFEQALIGTFSPGQPTVFETKNEPLVISDWPETPWQLIKPGLAAAHLGIPDLNGWLRANSDQARFADPAPYLTQWHYRWALPLTCMVTVLLATPLAIHFSRRGPGGGVFLAVVLSALLLLVTSISLALGEAGTLQPAHAAWLPNVMFTLLGLYLFHRRISGKPIYLILRRLCPGND